MPFRYVIYDPKRLFNYFLKADFITEGFIRIESSFILRHRQLLMSWRPGTIVQMGTIH